MIKTPIETLKNVTEKKVGLKWGDPKITWSDSLFNVEIICEAIEAYHNQFESINKQLAVNFAQSLLKDHSTQEVTLETFNDFLNIK